MKSFDVRYSIPMYEIGDRFFRRYYDRISRYVKDVKVVITIAVSPASPDVGIMTPTLEIASWGYDEKMVDIKKRDAHEIERVVEDYLFDNETNILESDVVRKEYQWI